MVIAVRTVSNSVTDKYFNGLIKLLYNDSIVHTSYISTFLLIFLREGTLLIIIGEMRGTWGVYWFFNFFGGIEFSVGDEVNFIGCKQ